MRHIFLAFIFFITPYISCMESDQSEPRVIETIPLEPHQFVRHAVISPDATICALCRGYYDSKKQELEKLELYSLTPFEKVNEFPIKKRVDALKFSNDSQKLFAIVHNKFHIFNLASESLEKVFKSKQREECLNNQIFTDSLWSIEDYHYDDENYQKKRRFIFNIFKNSSKACELIRSQIAARKLCHISSDGKNFGYFPKYRMFKVIDLVSGTTIKKIHFIKNPYIETITLTNQLNIFLEWEKVVIKHNSKRHQWTEHRTHRNRIQFNLSTDKRLLLIKNDRYCSVMNLQSFPPQKLGRIDALEILNSRKTKLLACQGNIVLGESIIGDEYDENNQYQNGLTIFDISDIVKPSSSNI